jgi:hypothetical protein
MLLALGSGKEDIYRLSPEALNITTMRFLTAACPRSFGVEEPSVRKNLN